ncbi:MAG: hypothetical protein DME69_11455 [Verrucomicrobia bacterium]|nr:MAG: hypothetical protein DME69_11455 [Verrucomicrobiota bacterium]
MGHPKREESIEAFVEHRILGQQFLIRSQTVAQALGPAGDKPSPSARQLSGASSRADSGAGAGERRRTEKMRTVAKASADGRFDRHRVPALLLDTDDLIGRAAFVDLCQIQREAPAMMWVYPLPVLPGAR